MPKPEKTDASQTRAYVMTVPAIDTLFSYNRRRTQLGDALETVRLFFTPESVPDEFNECEDIDSVDRYHDGHGNFSYPSATEKLVTEQGMLKDPGVPEVVAMLADNNGCGPNTGRGGYLKKLDWSFAELIKEGVPYFHHSVAMDDHLREWVTAFDRVIGNYFRVHQEILAVGGKLLDPEAAAAFREHFPEIADGLGKYLDEGYMSQPEALLTLPGYLVGLGSLMTADEWLDGGKERFLQEYRFWNEAFDRMHAIHEGARERAKEIRRALAVKAGPHRFFNQESGVYVQTDNRLVARYLWPLLKKTVLVMIIREKVREDAAGGHVIIQVNRRAPIEIDLLYLYMNLSDLEPECWYYETRYDTPMILNASAKIRNMPRSKLEPSAIIDIVAKEVQGQVEAKTKVPTETQTA